MPLYIEDDRVAKIVTELAVRLKVTEQDAVKFAVQAELDRLPKERFYEKLQACFKLDIKIYLRPFVFVPGRPPESKKFT